MRRSNSIKRTATLNSYDLLKLIALAAMTLDHYGYYIVADTGWWRVAGRLAAPIFCFLVGYNRSYRFRGQLLIFAVAMTVIDGCVTGAWLPLNILWPILFARMALDRLERRKLGQGELIAALAIALPASELVCEYGTLVLLWALWGRSIARGNRRESLIYAVAGTALGIVSTAISFPWPNPLCTVAMVMEFLLLAIVFQRFTLRNLSWRAPVLMFLSQQALAYYVLHKAFFEIVGKSWL